MINGKHIGIFEKFKKFFKTMKKILGNVSLIMKLVQDKKNNWNHTFIEHLVQHYNNEVMSL